MRTPNTAAEVEALPADAVVAVTEQEQVVPIVHIARTIPKPWSAAGVQARRDMANAKAAVARAAAVAAQRVAMELAEDEEDDVEDEEERMLRRRRTSRWSRRQYETS